MSRRKKQQQQAITALPPFTTQPIGVAAVTAATPAAAEEGPALLRRVLLMLGTAWLVARPLVLGDDPGMVHPWTSTAGLVFTQLLFVLVVGWAIWRWWGGKGQIHIGPVEALLLVVVGCVLVSTNEAHYRQPAVLIAWEWVAYALALFVVRQLASGEAEQRGLTAVLLASLVSLAGHGVGQFFFQLPPHPVEYDRRRLVAAKLEHLLGHDFVNLPPALSPHATATFAGGEQFATFIVLLAPVAVGAFLARWQNQPRHWQTWLTLATVLLAAWALWLTFAPLAMAALAVAGLIVLLFLAVRGHVSWPAALGGGAALAVLSAGMFYGAGWFQSADTFDDHLAQRRELWAATRQLAGEHTWGVGPGNVTGPLVERTTAEPLEASPHSFVLEVWASSGFLATAALVAAFVTFLALMVRRERSTTESWAADSLAAELPAAPVAPPGRYAHWEFYSGGMGGLLLGYLLSVRGRSPDQALYGVIPSQDDLFNNSVVAGLQAVLWFLAFALFVSVPWSRRLRGVVLTTGALAALLHLLVADGIGAPALALPLLAVLALALNSRGAPTLGGQAGNWLALVAPFPVAVGVGLAYLLTIFLPVLESETQAVAAQTEGRMYLYDRQQQPRRIEQPRIFVNEQCIQPLHRAATDATPGDARRQAQLAYWYGELWQGYVDYFNQRPQRSPSVVTLEEWQGRKPESGDGARPKMVWANLFAIAAEERDPEGLEGPLMSYHIQRRFARGLKDLQKQALGQGWWPGVACGAAVAHTSQDKYVPAAVRVQESEYWRKEKVAYYREAAESAGRLVARQPNNPHWHYLRALALDEYAQALREELRQTPAKVREALQGRGEATEKAMDLDARARPGQRLSAAQRERLRAWRRPVR